MSEAPLVPVDEDRRRPSNTTPHVSIPMSLCCCRVDLHRNKSSGEMSARIAAALNRSPKLGHAKVLRCLPSKIEKLASWRLFGSAIRLWRCSRALRWWRSWRLLFGHGMLLMVALELLPRGYPTNPVFPEVASFAHPDPAKSVAVVFT
jgi:hypothetical protein